MLEEAEPAINHPHNQPAFLSCQLTLGKGPVGCTGAGRAPEESKFQLQYKTQRPPSPIPQLLFLFSSLLLFLIKIRPSPPLLVGSPRLRRMHSDLRPAVLVGLPCLPHSGFDSLQSSRLFHCRHTCLIQRSRLAECSPMIDEIRH